MLWMVSRARGRAPHRLLYMACRMVRSPKSLRSDRPGTGSSRYDCVMAWIKVPPEHHPIFLGALPRDPRIETRHMFGGIAAKVNGHVFAGLFGRSTMIWLPESERGDALALPGAAPFDPMGDGRARSEKVMLPERMMATPAELRRWVARAFNAAAELPPKTKAVQRPRQVKARRAAKEAKSAARYAVDARVDKYFDSLPDWQRKACQRIRDLVHAADREVVETIKRTKLPFFVVQGNVCALLAAKDHVNVFLYDGGIAPDPHGIITGGHDNRTARTMAIYEDEAIKARAFTALIKQIIANNRAGGWRKLKKARAGSTRARV
jgi:TfoX/Sxy family transcriptional regulator of competence genes